MTRSARSELSELVDGFKLSQAIYVAAELGVADLVPAGIDELAAETGTHPPTLYRLMQALAAAGLFREGDDRTFALAPAGEALRSDSEPSMRDWVLHTARPVNWNAWAGLLDSVRDGSNTFARLHGEGIWAYRAARPEDQEVFDRGMAALTRRLNHALLEAYDFSPFGTVVDVGGGNGALLKALVDAHPEMHAILFDQPHVVGGVEGLEVVGGDFFESVPAAGDAYVLKSIAHDWEDEDVLRILASIRRAASAGAVVLIVERDLGAPNADVEAKLSDLTMLVLPGGRERTEAEFASLLGAAGFRYSGATPVLGSIRVFEGRL